MYSRYTKSDNKHQVLVSLPQNQSASLCSDSTSNANVFIAEVAGMYVSALKGLRRNVHSNARSPTVLLPEKCGL